MALQKPSPSVAPSENYRRFGLAFDQIDALGAALQGEVEERQNTIAAFGRQTQAALDDLSAALANESDTRAGEIAATLLSILAVVFDPRRPGVSPNAFGTTAIGSVAAISPLDPSACIATPFGPAYRISGAGSVALRAATPMDPDAIKILQVRYWRLADVLDPNNNAVEVGIQWLDAADGDLGRTLLRQDRSLMVQDGPRILTVRVPSLTGSVPVIAAPKGTVSWRPYLRTYGSDGATVIGVLGVSDATFAGVYAPDVSAIAARLGTIEGQLDAGLPLTAPILPSYAVANLPQAGNRGRKAFASDGRAPNAAGTLEAANAGTGVEVTDNGSAWVITGTNQQVQA